MKEKKVNPNPRLLTHFAAVVENLEETAELWTKALEPLGIHPWRIFDSRKGGEDHAGNLCKMHIGETTLIKVGITELDALNGLSIELIEPLEGDSIWSRFLEEHGNCWQHVEFVQPWEECKVIIDSFEKAGAKKTFDLEFPDGRHAVYFELPGGIPFCIAPPH